MFEPSPAPFSLLQRVCSAVRAESCAAAERLVAIGELYALRMREAGETEEWAVDAADAVTAEVAAVLSINHQLAASHLRYAQALREQVPVVGRAFIAGDIDEATFRTVVFRTGLIMETEVLAEVDRRLGLLIGRWGPLNRHQLSARIDQVVAGADLDAVRRRRERPTERDVVVGDVEDGLSVITATVSAPDAHAFAARVAAVAATVCDADPRTVGERRADAMGSVTVGADTLQCRCGRSQCPAGGKVASAVVIHVVAEQGTVDGTSQRPATMIGYEGLIPAELIAKLAQSARLRPLIHPRDCAAEPGYVPSRVLADFVRCRDLTCRFPGCSAPATLADIDHTIPFAQGGPTQASNLKCLCRLHHLIKTFWGWTDRQLADGTVIWTGPAGEVYVTHPGSALLLPGLCAPTRPIRGYTMPAPSQRANGYRGAMMPKRRRTRAALRTAQITAERHHNHTRRTTTPTPAPTPGYVHDSGPPPF